MIAEIANVSCETFAIFYVFLWEGFKFCTAPLSGQNNYKNFDLVFLAQKGEI